MARDITTSVRLDEMLDKFLTGMAKNTDVQRQLCSTSFSRITPKIMITPNGWKKTVYPEYPISVLIRSR